MAMVLSKLLRRPLPKLAMQQHVAIEELDAWLDVSTEEFDARVQKLARGFAKAEVSLDLAGYRSTLSDGAKKAHGAMLPNMLLL